MSQPSPQTCRLVDARDNYSCIRCGISLYQTQGSRHHRMPRSHAPKTTQHSPENLILLCGSGTTGCHGWVHSHPKDSYKNGWLVHSWDNPQKIPVTTKNYGPVILTHDGAYQLIKDTTE